jgi:transglutaminase/protease-like cytokinesis protein 3
MKFKKTTFALLIFLLDALLISGQRLPNERLFNYALATPDSVETKYRNLTDHLAKAAGDEKELVEVIFYWTAINIQYVDDPEYEMGDPDSIAVTTLRSKKSGCEGTARLFHELCRAAGIKSEIIFGFAVGLSAGGHNTSNPNHGWNAVYVDDKWELVDATWGAGGSYSDGGSLVRVKEVDMRYFFADPQDFIIDHYPEEQKWQLLDEPVSKREFFGDFYDLKRMAWHTRWGD